MEDWLNGPEKGWFETRWGIWNERDRERSERQWALAEIVCAVVTLATLALSFAIIAAAMYTPLPKWVTGWPIQLLMSGAVGYGTNFLAVQMLFHPREPYTSFPLRYIWRQGMIPAKQAEMSAVVGDQVARRLLTSEAAAEEISSAIVAVFDDDDAFRALSKDLLAEARKHLPRAWDALVPELVDALEEPLVRSVEVDKLRSALVEWLVGWLADPESRVQLREFGGRFLRARAPTLVDLLQRLVRRYKKTGSARSAAFSFSEQVNIIDWDDMEKALRKMLVKPSGLVWIDRFVAELAEAAPAMVDAAIGSVWIGEMRVRFVAVLKEAGRKLSGEDVGDKLMALFDDDERGARFRDELRTHFKPALRAWIAGGGLKPILERFDVRRRVAEATAALDVRVLEDMANRIGAYHLAAIQVLGYVLGILAGILLVAINILSGAG